LKTCSAVMILLLVVASFFPGRNDRAWPA
jgi:hypothetical protein